MKKFKFKLINLDGNIIEKNIEKLICKTPLGEITILKDHHPLITVVNAGKIEIINEDKKEELYLITNSILEVTKNEAKIICFSY